MHIVHVQVQVRPDCVEPFRQASMMAQPRISVKYACAFPEESE